MYRANELILRKRQLVIPEKFQKATVKAAYSMGHVGMAVTKQMLRRLNSLVEGMISKCLQCQISSDKQTQEPVKPTEIPEMAWHTISAHCGGPYPDGHYNLVVSSC